MIMDKKELVARALERGHLLAPSLLENLSPHEIGTIQGKEIVLTQKTVTVDDVTHYYQEKYASLKAILEKKLTPVSISNSTKTQGKATVLGMVRELTPHGFVVEDLTGGIDVVTTKKVAPKDVVGVVGTVREGKLIEDEIIYPDIPLPKGAKPKTTIYLTPTEARVGDERHPLATSPDAFIVGGVKVLFFKGRGNPLEWLKKRHLPEDITFLTKESLITTVPDVLVVFTDENRASMYKGVVIVQIDKDSKASVVVDSGAVEFNKI